MRQQIALIVLWILSACTLAGCNSTAQPQGQAEMTQLRDEVATLRAENARLKSQIESAATPFKTSQFQLTPTLEPTGNVRAGAGTITIQGATISNEQPDQVSYTVTGVSGAGPAQQTGKWVFIATPTTQTTQPATRPATQPQGAIQLEGWNPAVTVKLKIETKGEWPPEIRSDSHDLIDDRPR